MKYSKLLAITLSTVILAACGGGGTTVTVPVLTVSSTSYTDGGVIPVKYASTAQAGGLNTSPALTITNVPTGTSSLAIVMDDETAPCGTGANACVHWGVFNLQATKVSITENENLGAIAGVVLGGNWKGVAAGYEGPNPPNNHVYNLTVYALNSTAAAVTAPVKYTRSQFEAAFAGKIIEKATYVGKYPL